MTTRNKILLVILLAVLCSWLFGCSEEHYVPLPSTTNGVVDTPYLQSLYQAYNAGYFRNRLPKDVEINDFESNPNFMATTMCTEDGKCVIQFNPHFIVAPRTAELTMQHEMCHVKTWGKDVDTLGKQIDHGRSWRTCMLQLDAEGAVREVLIDDYRETMQ